MGFDEVRVLIVPTDHERSLRFWTEGVGLAVHEVFDDGAGVLLALGPGVLLELAAAAGGATPGGGPLVLSAQVADADAAHRRLVDAGLGPTGPATQPWGHRSFELTDPDGHRLTLFEVVGAGATGEQHAGALGSPP